MIDIPHPKLPPPDPEGLAVAIALMVAQFGVFGSAADRQALFRDLLPIAGAYPVLRDIISTLVMEPLSEAERWRAYHRAEAAAAAWVKRQNRQRCAAGHQAPADLRRSSY